MAISGGVYGMAFIGAVVYYPQHAVTLEAGGGRLLQGPGVARGADGQGAGDPEDVDQLGWEITPASV